MVASTSLKGEAVKKQVLPWGQSMPSGQFRAVRFPEEGKENRE